MDSVKDASFWKVVRQRQEEQLATDLERIKRGEMPDEKQRPSHGRRMSERRKEEVRELLREGLSASEITFELQCSHDTVVRIRREMGLTDPNAGPVGIWASVQPDVKRLWAKGLSKGEIARRLGVSHNTVRKAIAREAA